MNAGMNSEAARGRWVSADGLMSKVVSVDRSAAVSGANRPHGPP